jgi:hypothetical protein
VFNLVGNLYKGLKNSKLVEIIVFDILLALNLGECEAAFSAQHVD